MQMRKGKQTHLTCGTVDMRVADLRSHVIIIMMMIIHTSGFMSVPLVGGTSSPFCLA